MLNPCGYEDQVFAFLQPHLHIYFYILENSEGGTLYLSEFETKVGNTELEFGT